MACTDLVGADIRDEFSRKRPGSATIGNASRSTACNAPDLKAFPVGECSPGPQRYKDVGEAAKRVTRSSPKYSICCKRDTNPANSQTPQRVGPGSYPPMAPEMKYRTGPRFSIGKGEREKKS